MFLAILLFNPSLLHILFPTEAISKECSFSRTQPKIPLILTRCPGLLLLRETSGSPAQHCPLFHFWPVLSGANSSPFKLLIPHKPCYPVPPSTLFTSSPLPPHTVSSLSLCCCDKTFQEKATWGESGWFQLTGCSPLLKESGPEAEITEEGCLLALSDSCTANFPYIAQDHLSKEWYQPLWTEPSYMD